MSHCRGGRSAPGVFGVLSLLLCATLLMSCGSVDNAPANPPPPPPPVPLSAADVQQVVENAAKSLDAPMVIAVADRAGKILAVFQNAGAPTTSTGNFSVAVDSKELAVALARTAAFFSNNQAPLSSRTVRFISGIHFPPGVVDASNGDLYGIENTNRGCMLNTIFLPGQNINPARSIDGLSLGLGIITGKADTMDSDPTAVNPGGVPLFKNGYVVGGVGVVSTSPDVAEFAAFSGASQPGFLPSPSQLPPPGVVIIGGVTLPFVNQTTPPNGIGPGTTVGTYTLGPLNGGLPPEGDLVATTGGFFGLTQNDVANIISQAVTTAEITRAVIRLPPGSRTKMTIAVTDLDGTILGLHRMSDATVFSIDVAVAKARNVIYFSGPTGTPDLPGVPPGIDGSGLGPFFKLYTSDIANPCTQGSQAANADQNGIVFFPGSVPLYKNGVLVGGLGVSGDGVDQDDFVTNGGAKGFEAPDNIRADQVIIDGVRLPYLKFPRNPTQ